MSTVWYVKMTWSGLSDQSAPPWRAKHPMCENGYGDMFYYFRHVMEGNIIWSPKITALFSLNQWEALWKRLFQDSGMDMAEASFYMQFALLLWLLDFACERGSHFLFSRIVMSTSSKIQNVYLFFDDLFHWDVVSEI